MRAVLLLQQKIDTLWLELAGDGQDVEVEARVGRADAGVGDVLEAVAEGPVVVEFPVDAGGTGELEVAAEVEGIEGVVCDEGGAGAENDFEREVVQFDESGQSQVNSAGGFAVAVDEAEGSLGLDFEFDQVTEIPRPFVVKIDHGFGAHHIAAVFRAIADAEAVGIELGFRVGLQRAGEQERGEEKVLFHDR